MKFKQLTKLFFLLTIGFAVIIYGCKKEESTEEVIPDNTIVPIADFNADQLFVDQGINVNFTDISKNSPVVWSWDFGDGATSEEQNPSHDYSEIGTYKVSLTVANTAGSDKKSVKDFITVNFSGFSTFMDTRDTTEYKTIVIGGQIWMAENLKYNTGWQSCWPYDNDETNIDIYGYLYDWEASKFACPVGWHLPDDNEWLELINFLGGDTIAGGKMKTTGFSMWEYPNDGANNESHFSAIPAGIRYSNGNSAKLGEKAYFWSITDSTATHASTLQLLSGINDIFHFTSSKNLHHSVRCVKD